MSQEPLNEPPNGPLNGLLSGPLDEPLWTLDAMAQAMRAERRGALPRGVSGISIDSRSIAAGEAFFAIAGDNRDGHDFVAAALAAGAALAVVAADRRAKFAASAPLLVVPDVLVALRELGQAARARSQAKFIGVTGSVGKTSTKEALRLALAGSGETHASVASYNNHWGVPLSLARCPSSARYAVLEIGMNRAGEIAALAPLARPHIAIITTIEPVHLEFFASIEAIADTKAEIFRALDPAGAAVLNRDNPQFARLREDARADARLIKASLHPECSTVQARILGTELAYKVGAPGRHLVHNSLAVLAAASLAGADLALAALALARLEPAAGRGSRITLETPDGPLLLIDESYNANPASMRAALALLGQAQVGQGGRRIAVLGDMLELGPQGPELHRQLLESLLAHGVDVLFCCGASMRSLWETLPFERRGGYAETSALLEPQVLAAIRPGDALMVKGSLGSRMGRIVKALEGRHSRRAASAAA